MLGFIKKDLLMIKGNLKTYLIMFVVYVVMAFQENFDSSFMLSFLCVVIMMATFGYDTYNNWDSYAATLPNGRKNMVSSKYVLTFLLIIVTAVLVTAISLGTAYYHHEVIDIVDILLKVCGSVIGTVVVEAFMYPIIFKFGIEKARIYIFAIVFGLIFVMGILLKYVDLSFVGDSLSSLGKYGNVLGIVLLLLVLIGSYMLSLRIYLKKEF